MIHATTTRAFWLFSVAHTASLTVGTEAGCHAAQDGRGHVTGQPALALSGVFCTMLEFDVFIVSLLPPGEKPGFLKYVFENAGSFY